MERFKILLGALLLTVSVVGAFAFTSKDYHKAVDVVCYHFDTAITPADATVIEGLNYVAESGLDCPTVRQRYCAICFDKDLYGDDYIKLNGTLNFLNTDLSSAVLSAYASPANQGMVINGITFHFRNNP